MLVLATDTRAKLASFVLALGETTVEAVYYDEGFRRLVERTILETPADGAAFMKAIAKHVRSSPQLAMASARPPGAVQLVFDPRTTTPEQMAEAMNRHRTRVRAEMWLPADPADDDKS